MTEADLLVAVTARVSVIQDGREFGLALLSGYLAVAYFLGSRLTLFRLAL